NARAARAAEIVVVDHHSAEFRGALLAQQQLHELGAAIEIRDAELLGEQASLGRETPGDRGSPGFELGGPAARVAGLRLERVERLPCGADLELDAAERGGRLAAVGILPLETPLELADAAAHVVELGLLVPLARRGPGNEQQRREQRAERNDRAFEPPHGVAKYTSP